MPGEKFAPTERLLAMNPVKAGLVDKPEDWPWGSVRQRGEKDREE
jgi:hypothetical protein